jgi:O-antigen ligase
MKENRHSSGRGRPDASGRPLALAFPLGLNTAPYGFSGAVQRVSKLPVAGRFQARGAAATVPEPAEGDRSGAGRRADRPGTALMAAFATTEASPYARAVEGLGWAGMAGFALTAWINPSISQMALGISALALLASPAARTALRGDPAFRFALLFTLYLAGTAVWGRLQFPESGGLQFGFLGRWAFLFGFLIIAWWLKGDLRRINGVWLLAVAGLFYGLWRHADPADLLAFRTGRQTGFQMKAPVSGLISASVMLGLLLFAGRLFRGGRGLGALLPALPWLAGLFLCAYGLVASQSRITWIAAALVFPVALGFFYYRSIRQGTRLNPRLLMLPLLALALVLGGISVNSNTILGRIGPDRDTAAMILRGDDRPLPVSSWKYRYLVQKFGLEKWLEKPLAGWGAGSTKPLIRSADRPELFNETAGQWMGHTHNTYLEILVRFGLLGVAAFAAGAWIVGRRCAEGLRRMPVDYRLWLLGSGALTALWSAANFGLTVNHWPHWSAYWLLLMGVAYTFVLHKETSNLEQ